MKIRPRSDAELAIAISHELAEDLDTLISGLGALTRALGNLVMACWWAHAKAKVSRLVPAERGSIAMLSTQLLREHQL